MVLKTRLGGIVIELDRAAAPRAVERWLRLVKGPIFDPELVGDSEALPPMGYYDGLTFDYTKPHVEVITAGRPPIEAFRLPVEIDAEALGLNKQVVEDVGEAMNVLQFELIKTYGRLGKGGSCPPLLLEWIGAWHETHDASFLVGESRTRINEAQGFVYQEGLASAPVTRGSVSLKPLSATAASARMSIALADIPQRTGRWMVIGRVVQGLDIVDRLALAPLEGHGTPRARNYAPLDPVVIEAAEISYGSYDAPPSRGAGSNEVTSEGGTP